MKIPGYVLKREVGSGGMASVYLAVQKSLDRRVALKVMSAALAADQSFTKRFLREAKTVAALSHPNIVSIYDIGVVSGSQLHYFSMQYLPNGDLSTRIRNGVSEKDLVHVMISMARALGYAHELGYVHRDVKPGNILFDQTDTPILTDFGIARAASHSTRMTGTGVSVGTSHYMSPEQARGKDVDRRSDLYSLGALAFEALAGRPPYDGEDGFAIAYSHVFDPIPSLPPPVAKWQPFIDKALAKTPEDRFQKADEMIEFLKRFSGDSKLILSNVNQPAVDQTTPLPVVQGSGAARPPFDPGRAFDTMMQVCKGAPGHFRYRFFDAIDKGVNAVAGVFAAGCEKALPFLPLHWRPIGGWLLILVLISVSAIMLGDDEEPVPPQIVETPVDAGTDTGPATTDTPAVGTDSATASTTPDPTDLNPATGDPPGTDPDPTTATGVDTVANLGFESDGTPIGDPVVVDAATTEPATDSSDAPAQTARSNPEVDAIIALAQQDLEENRLTTPAGNNAYDRFVSVLLMDPGNVSAMAGLSRIIQRYLSLVADRSRANDFAQAATYLARAENVADVTGNTADARLVAGTRANLLSSATDAARSAMDAGNRDLARTLYNSALTLDPDDPELQAAVEALRDPFEKFERFADPLSNGETGPNMVVVELQPFDLIINGSEFNVLDSRRIAVSETEITVGNFGRFLAATGYYNNNRPSSCRDIESRWRSSRDRTWNSPGFPVNDNHPVTCVDWDAANAFASWIASETGFSYRLPSESEWEFLALGSLPDDGNICARENVGDLWYKQVDAESAAYNCEDGWTYTAPVDSFGLGPMAISGILGNVREWTADCWVDDRMRGATTYSPNLSGDCGTRVVKGVAWMHGAGADDPARRVGFDRDDAYNTVGFRLVRNMQ